MEREKVMRITKVFAVGFLVLASAAAAGGSLAPGAAGDAADSYRLPESLDAYYPPTTDRPVYLFKMLSLETSFSGIIVDLMEGDLDGAVESFWDFQRRYREMAGMIPEWQGRFPQEKVQELGAALVAGDRGLAANAFESAGEICHGCHLEAMVPVQQKYHWGDFTALEVWDPLSGKATGFRQFKQVLSTNLAGITVDLRQGQIANARKQFEGFRARFEALRDTCRTCHEKESRHFVDSELQKTVEELGKTLQSQTVVADQAAALIQEIGRESCSKCHLVHLPAAFARYPVR